MSPSTAPNSPSQTTAEGVLMLTGQGPLGGTTSTKYFLYVISTDGRILRSASGGIPSVGWHLPRFSVAGHSVYFIDGDRNMMVLRDDGTITSIAQLPGDDSDRVVFAVSPDEQQVVYSVVHVSGAGITTSLRVGRIDGTGAHEIYSGSGAEVPIGWRGGHVVLAVVSAMFPQNAGEVNPYWAAVYHIADVNTATRTFSTPPSCDSSLQGPVNVSGSVCEQRSGNAQILLALGWDGSSREMFRSVVDGIVNAVPPVVLNPNGQTAAAGIAADHRISVIANGAATPSSASGTPAGWFDSERLLFVSNPEPMSVAVLDLKANSVTPVGSSLTGFADTYAPFFVPIPDDLG